MRKIAHTAPQPSRRQSLSLATAGSAGLIIGFKLPFGFSRAAALSSQGSLAPNAFIRIAPDSSVTILSKHIEFGQGPFTGLATEVEVHIVPSGQDPTGVGEPGVPPIAPAVANAFAALTGKSVRRLPFQRTLS